MWGQKYRPTRCHSMERSADYLSLNITMRLFASSILAALLWLCGCTSDHEAKLFSQAVAASDYETVREMSVDNPSLVYGPEANPVFFALMSGDTVMVRYLIALGADPNRSMYHAVMMSDT